MYATFEDVERWIRARHYPLSISVMTSCTGVKLAHKARAEELYIGEQHRRLMQGVRVFRDECGEYLDLRIMSAKHGLVMAGKELEPYDESFGSSGGRVREMRERGQLLGLPEAVRDFLDDGSVELRLIALGASYYEAGGFADMAPPEGHTVVLASEGWGGFLAVKWPKAMVVSLGSADTRRFSCGFVGLKGEAARRLLLVAAEASGRIAGSAHA